MKQMHLAASLCAALLAASVSPATAADDPAATPQQVNVPRQRVGDLIVQGSVAPAWLVPALGAPQVQRPPAVLTPDTAPPPRSGNAPAARMGSSQWRERIEALQAEIETRRGDLAQARESLITAVNDEAKEAQEQYLAAQRRAEDMKRQAERAAALATAARPAPPPAPATVPAASAVAASPANAPAEIVFALRKADRTMAAALARWAEEARQPVLWEAKDLPVSFEDSYAMALPDAVFKVVTALNTAGEDLLMCEYRNRVVRVVPSAWTCRINRNIQQNSADGAAK